MKIAINGFGRIGRAAFKIAFSRKNLEIVAINDLTDIKIIAHLLEFDSIFGHYEKKITIKENNLVVDGKEIRVLAEKEPKNLPWQELGVDVVLECTGIFLDQKSNLGHLEAGAKKVIISAPPKDEETKIFCIGCNEKNYQKEKDHIISNASCTTNCLAPMAKVINDNLGIEKALMSTIHSYTSTQNLVDGPNKDVLRARAATLSIIPSTTGAAIAVTKVIPELKGKFDGMSFRIPTPCVSVVDMVAKIRQKATVEKLNSLFLEASQNRLKGILATENRPLVSTDFLKNPASSIVDLTQTMVLGDNFIKVVSWYDNEWGYSERLVDMAEMML